MRYHQAGKRNQLAYYSCLESRVGNTYTLFTQDFLNRLVIGFLVNQLVTGLNVTAFTHSHVNRLRLSSTNIDILYICNYNNVGGVFSTRVAGQKENFTNASVVA